MKKRFSVFDHWRKGQIHYLCVWNVCITIVTKLSRWVLYDISTQWRQTEMCDSCSMRHELIKTWLRCLASTGGNTLNPADVSSCLTPSLLAACICNTRPTAAPSSEPPPCACPGCVANVLWHILSHDRRRPKSKLWPVSWLCATSHWLITIWPPQRCVSSRGGEDGEQPRR